MSNSRRNRLGFQTLDGSQCYRKKSRWNSNGIHFTLFSWTLWLNTHKIFRLTFDLSVPDLRLLLCLIEWDSQCQLGQRLIRIPRDILPRMSCICVSFEYVQNGAHSAESCKNFAASIRFPHPSSRDQTRRSAKPISNVHSVEIIPPAAA